MNGQGTNFTRWKVHPPMLSTRDDLTPQVERNFINGTVQIYYPADCTLNALVLSDCKVALFRGLLSKVQVFDSLRGYTSAF